MMYAGSHQDEEAFSRNDHQIQSVALKHAWHPAVSITQTIEKHGDERREWEEKNSTTISRNKARIQSLMNPDELNDIPFNWGSCIFKRGIKRRHRYLFARMFHVPCKGYGYIKFTINDAVTNETASLVLKDVDVADTLAWYHSSRSIMDFEGRYMGNTTGKDRVDVVLSQYSTDQILAPLDEISQFCSESGLLLSYGGIYGALREHSTKEVLLLLVVLTTTTAATTITITY